MSDSTPTPPVQTIRPRLVRRDPRALTPLDMNARYMRKEEWDRLVANVAADGCLTSVPLIYGAGEHEEGHELILSGNHRTAAAVEVGLADDDALFEVPSRRQLRAGNASPGSRTD